MATRISSNPRTVANASADYSRAEKVANAMRTAKELLMNADVRDFLALYEENASLRDKNKTLEADIESQCRRTASYQVKHDEAEKVSKIRESKLNQALREKDDLTAKLKEAQRELGEKQKRMIVSNSALWTNLKEHTAVKKDIPIPIDNTPVATQMRVASFLAILAYETDQHIFQPTYLLRNSTELNMVLDEVAGDDSNREAHIRSVLLRLSEWVYEGSDPVTASHIQTVVKNVSACVLDLVPDKLKDSFSTKLNDICTEACKHWAFIQRLDGKLDTDFEFKEQEPTSWKPLFPVPPPSSLPVSKPNMKPNSTTPANKKPSTSPTQSPTTPTPGALADPVVVWPAFYNRSSEEQETLVPGYMLTASQVAVAKSEEKAQQPTGPRRNQRQQGRSARAMSMSGGQGLSLSLNSSEGLRFRTEVEMGERAVEDGKREGEERGELIQVEEVF
ncbi:hypothetical protein VTI74DRAFT_5417 [Chaetomium olivicolor]